VIEEIRIQSKKHQSYMKIDMNKKVDKLLAGWIGQNEINLMVKIKKQE
jgi:hypothetical protein